MLRKSGNILVQYSLITFVMTLVVTIISGFWLGDVGKNHLIESHIDFYPQLIHHMLDGNNGTRDFFLAKRAEADLTALPERLKDHIDMFLEIDSVVEVKLWSTENQVLWSNNSSIIGKWYPDSGPFQEREPLDSVLFELEPPSETDHPGEKKESTQLEIYIPVNSGGATIGAFEIYESNNALNRKIQLLIRGNMAIIAVAGLALYTLLLGLFVKSYKDQQRVNRHLEKSENAIIYALAYQAGLRDEETGLHLKRTAAYVNLLADVLSRQKPFKQYMDKRYIRDLVKSAPLHDIGKVGISDTILRKPGKLSDTEFMEIKRHCLLGASILEEALIDIPFQSFLDIAINLVKYHHEKWDGSGYPEGRRGEAIPISARIMALADVYDALRSKRYYKESFHHERCVEIIKEGRGTHFDPAVVDAFLEVEETFYAISVKMADNY